MSVKHEEQDARLVPPLVPMAPEPKSRKSGLAKAAYVDKAPVVGLPYMSDDEDEDYPDPNAVELSDEQQAVLDKVKAGRNIFFTGSAGTGKSVLLREIIRWCRHTARKKTAVIASTGIAGYHIGGSTLHSWAGVRLGIGSAKKLVSTIRRRGEQENRKARKRLGEAFDETGEYYRPLYNWLTAEVLVIDEISMIPAPLFGKLEKIARVLRHNEQPFGGIQLVLAGDFYQLPPVHKAGRKRPLLAFEAGQWNKCIGPPIVLTKVFRQKEPEFIDMLNSVRLAQVDNKVIDLLQRLSRQVEYNDDVEPIDLYPLRGAVEAENLRRLGEIEVNGREYEAQDIGGMDEIGELFAPRLVQRHLDELAAPKLLKVKLGARVMLVMNLVQGRFVNGSIGEVVDFMTMSEAHAKQIPIGTPSISKSEVLMGIERQNDHHYTLLLEGEERWPLVNFHGYEMLCVPRTFTALTEDSEMLIAQRIQVPLILAWALTIHKSQGQTLSRLRIHIADVFDYGQAYVALSRATSLDTLEIVDFAPKQIKVHPVVVKWMNTHAAADLLGIPDIPAAPVPPLNSAAAPAVAHPRAPPLAIKPEPHEPSLRAKPEPEEPALHVKAEPRKHIFAIKPELQEPALPIKLEPSNDGYDANDDGNRGEVHSLQSDDVAGGEYTVEDEIWAQSELSRSIPEPIRPKKRKATRSPDTVKVRRRR